MTERLNCTHTLAWRYSIFMIFLMCYYSRARSVVLVRLAVMFGAPPLLWGGTTPGPVPAEQNVTCSGAYLGRLFRVHTAKQTSHFLFVSPPSDDGDDDDDAGDDSNTTSSTRGEPEGTRTGKQDQLHKTYSLGRKGNIPLV
ncbi:uncharacterized protein LOC134218279 [Armigeres subalbatus]|uniref:uncharacterized protein LOC134218279 n=1 Tax=Armigeres subalbatus TaxID=124917 RepID=UPI002ED0C341